VGGSGDPATASYMLCQVESIVDCLVWAVFRWTVYPPTSGLQHVHDPAQNASIILALRAGWLVGRSGRMFAHCSSLNQNKFARMVDPRFG
jgi:hypothetical protein